MKYPFDKLKGLTGIMNHAWEVGVLSLGAPDFSIESNQYSY